MCCLQVYDHFCPWIGNAVGKGNRHMFLIFVILMTIAISLGYAVTFGRMVQVELFSLGTRVPARPRVHLDAQLMWTILWPICNIPLLLSLFGLAGSQIAQVWLCEQWIGC